MMREELERDLADFFGLPIETAREGLNLGFHPLHAEVAADYRRAVPKDDEALLEWYRETTAYIWELSAYHLDPGFNYAGMCQGIAERLKAAGARWVLCLGDGIGDLTLSLRRAGIEAVYHELLGSRTAAFGNFRLRRHLGQEAPGLFTAGWEPSLSNFGRPFDAIVSVDFLEHVTDVPAWVGAIKQSLQPGGLLMAQNAFACGSGEGGSIPMHLARNDRYEKEWDPMMASLGFRQLSSNWYQLP